MRTDIDINQIYVEVNAASKGHVIEVVNKVIGCDESLLQIAQMLSILWLSEVIKPEQLCNELFIETIKVMCGAQFEAGRLYGRSELIREMENTKV